MNESTLLEVTCPECKGQGQKYLHLHYARGKGRSGWQWKTCWRCGGQGKITTASMHAIRAGEELNGLLEAKGMRYDLECLAPRGIDGVALSDALLGRVPLDRIAEIRGMVAELPDPQPT